MTVIRSVTVIAVLAVVYLTIGPLGVRSMSPLAAQYDRMLAYAVIGCLAMLSLPRRPWIAVALVAAMAILLEVAQRFTLDRHGHAIDAVEKLVGAAVGVGLTVLVRWWVGRRASPTP